MDAKWKVVIGGLLALVAWSMDGSEFAEDMAAFVAGLAILAGLLPLLFSTAGTGTGPDADAEKADDVDDVIAEPKPLLPRLFPSSVRLPRILPSFHSAHARSLFDADTEATAGEESADDLLTSPIDHCHYASQIYAD